MKISRLIKQLCCLLAFSLSASTSSFAGELGINFNGVIQPVNSEVLASTQTQWVRGFVDYFDYKSGLRDIKTDPNIARLKTLKAEGYKVILTLKYDFTDKDFPKNQAEADAELNYHSAIFDELYDYVDIIVAGNEPFIESKPSQRTTDLLVSFYKKTAQRARNYQVLNNKTLKPIYIGAFNRLWSTSQQTQAVEDYLAFAKATSWIAGADLHIHHDKLSQIDTVFNYVSPKLRNDQQILVTEFSFMKKWKENLSDPIPVELTRAPYNRPATLKVWQYIDNVLNPLAYNRVSAAEWETFLKNSDWYAPNYLRDSVTTFNTYPKFAVACYGFMQIYAESPAAYAANPFTADSDPWLLNPLFINRVVEQDGTGVWKKHFQYFDDFVRFQR